MSETYIRAGCRAEEPPRCVSSVGVPCPPVQISPAIFYKVFSSETNLDFCDIHFKEEGSLHGTVIHLTIAYTGLFFFICLFLFYKSFVQNPSTTRPATLAKSNLSDQQIPEFDVTTKLTAIISSMTQSKRIVSVMVRFCW